jgi:hypothetical protein
MKKELQQATLQQAQAKTATEIARAEEAKEDAALKRIAREKAELELLKMRQELGMG